MHGQPRASTSTDATPRTPCPNWKLLINFVIVKAFLDDIWWGKQNQLLSSYFPYYVSQCEDTETEGKTSSREKAIPFSARSSLILFQLEEQELCLQQLPTSIACKLRSYKYIEGWLFLHNLFWPPKKNENLLRTGALLIVSELQVRTESLLDLHSWQHFSDSPLVSAGTCTCWGSCKADKLSVTEQFPASEKLWSSAYIWEGESSGWFFLSALLHSFPSKGPPGKWIAMDGQMPSRFHYSVTLLG